MADCSRYPRSQPPPPALACRRRRATKDGSLLAGFARGHGGGRPPLETGLPRECSGRLGTRPLRPGTPRTRPLPRLGAIQAAGGGVTSGAEPREPQSSHLASKAPERQPLVRGGAQLSIRPLHGDLARDVTVSGRRSHCPALAPGRSPHCSAPVAARCEEGRPGAGGGTPAVGQAADHR